MLFRSSALENAETSAIGRALAAAGWGGTEFASANEVQNAIHQQNKKVDSVNFVEQIRGAKNVEELKNHFANAFAATKQDPIAVAAITAAKDARKAELAA